MFHSKSMIARARAFQPIRPLPDLPCRHRAQRSLRHHQSTHAAKPWLHPMAPHPDVALLVSRQDHRHGFGMDGSTIAVGAVVMNRRRDAVRGSASTATVTLELGPEVDKANGGRSSLSANHTTSFFLVSGFGSGAYSAKLFAGTKRRFSGFNQPRQWGEVVLRYW